LKIENEKRSPETGNRRQETENRDKGSARRGEKFFAPNIFNPGNDEQ